jgi:hypothetical protein
MAKLKRILKAWLTWIGVAVIALGMYLDSHIIVLTGIGAIVYSAGQQILGWGD